MQTEILRVLKMIEEGKIDAETGASLIASLKNSEEENLEIKDEYDNKNISKKLDETQIQLLKEEGEKFIAETPKNSEIMLYVFVISNDGDKVKIKIPIKFIKLMLAATNKIPSMSKVEDKVDMDLIRNAIDQGITGRIVEVESAEGDIVIVEIK
ncbi:MULTISPECIES: hypothetical protein [Clostridium]|uniref:YvlB/LiaX N-terminal domain-containing protein n=1 Tax=Clostridium senegalense TaxID=1465809 RepID=A0A6M0H659_9CLOT|nr:MULTISPECIES: hypothetical protein [Clostridium]NEU06027.1 hypothetical protein [Clostridium senegalense]